MNRLPEAPFGVTAQLLQEASETENYLAGITNQIIAFDHPGIVVSDISSALRQYKKELPHIKIKLWGSGQEEYFDCLDLSGKTVYRGKHTKNAGALQAVLILEAEQLNLELFQPVEGRVDTWVDFYNLIGEGLQHFAYQVKNLEQACNDLFPNGFTPLQYMDFGVGHCHYLSQPDTEYPAIELFELYGSGGVRRFPWV